MKARLAGCLFLALCMALLPACSGDGEVTDPKLKSEVDSVRKATAKYKDVKKALADGYVEARSA